RSPSPPIYTLSLHDALPIFTAVGVRGVVFTFGLGMTVGRVLVCSLSVGVQPVFRRLPFSERRLLRALVFVATLDPVVLAVRIVSMFTDSSIRETWTGASRSVSIAI